jgi:hypothetical protein
LVAFCSVFFDLAQSIFDRNRTIIVDNPCTMDEAQT